MIWVDWTIVVVLALSTLLSLKKGFVREALSLLAWVAAFLVSTSFGAHLSSQLVPWIAAERLRYAAAYVILFVATLMLGSLLNALLAQLIRVTGLSGADRLLGTVFGFIRGLVILLVALFVLRAVVPAEGQQVLEQSWLLPHLELLGAWARQNFADVAVRGEPPRVET